ncbi:hypothetical protein [Lactiplantibacillus pentosus]|uniref:hypothetical protein n=1 Tax=Lactiplantibacillus pentosus TaxID=1589 RepID=UPI0021A8EDBC|nr:hypothetical protein [Lactiplantibacillus pentosus]
MPWLAAVLMGFTIGVITNAVGTHDRRQVRVHLILGAAGAVIGQWLFSAVGPGIAGMRLLPVVGECGYANCCGKRVVTTQAGRAIIILNNS